MNCKICNGKADKFLTAKILNKYDGEYFLCKNCHFLFAGNPFWLKESYNNVINITDTGILQRNIYFSRIVSVIIYFFFNKEGTFIDYAGGYGIFTRLMRDLGFDFYWMDPYCENLMAKGFEYREITKNDISLLNAFEVFEHLENPLDEIKKMLGFSKNIIFTTQLLPDPVPEPDQWWYYGFEHGQHISFYSLNTFKYLSKKLHLNFYSAKGIHIITEKKINPALLKIILLLRKFGLFLFVRLKMKSKTLEDHLSMKRKL